MSGLGRIPVLIVASASIALWAFAGAAQQAGQRQALPIMVEADQGIEWIAEEKLYVARGNAVATRGDIRVSGETLSAVYREVEDGSPEFYQVEVTDNVVVTAPGRTLYGDRAVYDLDQAVVVMLGSDVRADLGAEKITARDSLEYWEVRRIAVARGNAQAVRGDRELRSDMLTTHFEASDDGSLEAVRISAIGNTVITTPDEVARGDQGTYDIRREIVILEGKVKITRGSAQLNGGRAEVDLAKGTSRLLPPEGGNRRVQGLFVPAPDKSDE